MISALTCSLLLRFQLFSDGKRWMLWSQIIYARLLQLCFGHVIHAHSSQLMDSDCTTSYFGRNSSSYTAIFNCETKWLIWILATKWLIWILALIVSFWRCVVANLQLRYYSLCTDCCNCYVQSPKLRMIQLYSSTCQLNRRQKKYFTWTTQKRQLYQQLIIGLKLASQYGKSTNYLIVHLNFYPLTPHPCDVVYILVIGCGWDCLVCSFRIHNICKFTLDLSTSNCICHHWPSKTEYNIDEFVKYICTAKPFFATSLGTRDVQFFE